MLLGDFKKEPKLDDLKEDIGEDKKGIEMKRIAIIFIESYL